MNNNIFINMSKYCKTIKNKKRCTKNKPQMNARDIISLQMNALQKGNKGIKIAWKYSSKLNKLSTGPYMRFERMVKNNIYKHLIKCKSWRFVPNTTQRKKDEHYSVMVKVISTHDNNTYYYRFALSRQIDTLFWRTDSVFAATTIKSKVKEKNIYNKKLEVCSKDPLTGYYRDGYCKTGPDDYGSHTICAEMTDEFLQYSKSKGNDLITPRGKFSGLKPGDHWCICSGRWKEAKNVGKSPPIISRATNKKALSVIES